MKARRNPTIDRHVRQVRTLERALATAKSDVKSMKARWHQSEEELSVAERKLELFTATASRFRGRQIDHRPLKPQGDAAAIIVATDWHAEQRVDAASVNGLNEFNLQVATRRIRRLWEKAVYLTESAKSISKIKTCVLAVLGDMITGDIHDELLETNFLSPTKAIAFVQEHLADGIRYLLKHGKFERIDVPCCVGNHGRTTRKPRVATRIDNNYEWLAYHNLASEFRKDKRVQFHIAEGYHQYLDVCGHACRFHHGDGMKYFGGVGGITIPVNKAIAQWSKSRHADYDFFGHWHQFLWHKSWVCCPSLIGYDPWSLWIKAEYEPPSQAFGVMDSKRGLCEMRPIYVEAA